MPTKKSASQIAREEWDFGTTPTPDYSGCPDDELQFCLVYEYARESKEIQATVEKFRVKGFPDGPVSVENKWRMRGLPYLSFLELFPEFPRVPWLKIAPKVRKKRISRLPHYDPEIAEVPRKEFSHTDFSQKYWNPRERFTVTALKINWAYSNDQLKDAFSEWVKLNRPDDFPEDQTHGKTTPRDMLKKLGAKRLLEKMTWNDAASLTKQFLGYNLYSSANAWRRAAEQAEDFVTGEAHVTDALRIIEKIDKKQFSPKELNRFFFWIGRAKPKILKSLVKLDPAECVAQIKRILADLNI